MFKLKIKKTKAKMLNKLSLLLGLAYISYTLSTRCKDGSKCPGSQTCCLAARGVGCCPYADAICCSDGQHCCPNGYVCGNSACYAPSQGSPALAMLLNTNTKSFLETSSFISTNENSDSVEKNDSIKKDSEVISSVERTVLDFNANSGTDKGLEILTDETSKTTTISNPGNEATFLSKSKFEIILEKLDHLNNTYMKKFFGCFKDLEPIVHDLIAAYREKKEKTETLINIVSNLVNKLAIDGAKMTVDCKAILALAGIAGLI